MTQQTARIEFNGAGEAAETRHRTFVATLEDSPGVLNRVSSLVRRRKFNIVSLSVGRTHIHGESRMTLVVDCDADTARQLEAHLRKLICVLDVQDISHEPCLLRDLALVRLRVGARERMEVFQLLEVFQARVIDVQPTSMIIEVTGDPTRIEGLAEVLRPYGIEEMVQCGAVAITTGTSGAAATPIR
ncbi:MAG: acetolactate synthase small subunit [Deltaproteobacteria bacterium]|nr:acetolactate synthase small subunit [Deltaproteobacteria bacterium]